MRIREGERRTAWRMACILEVRDLRVVYRPRGGAASEALSGVTFSLERGEILGVLGQSGSGKSTLATSLLGLFHSNACVATGAVLFEGTDLLQSDPEELQTIRGRRISLIFQEPSVALHPTMRAGEQVRQVLAAHETNGRRALADRTRAVLETVFPEETDRISRSYPHELSGGQRQRVLIAQAIACEPSVVIADEPTASLDPTTQMEILGVFRALQQRLGLAMIFITHNPALLARFADRVLVLYTGKVMEMGPAETVLASPMHPYTQALLRSVPPLPGECSELRKKKLAAIPGDSRAGLWPQRGCRFEPRCPERMEICKEREPALISLNDARTVSCFKYESK